MREIEKETTDYQAQRIVNQLYDHVLLDFIAHANEREVISRLYKFYTESDLILISKQQLRVYQELEKHSLALSAFDIQKEI